MNLKQDKRAIGKFNFDTIGNVILMVVGVVILFSVVASLFPTLVASGTQLNTSGFPLASLFENAGAAGWYLLAAGIILVIVKVVMPSGNK
jgi:uncharacterized membrane protein HdeD (DUF308 family)